MDALDPLPAWLASKIRRAALSSALSWAFPVAAVLLLLTGVEALWWSGNVDSVAVPLFWNAVFLVALGLLGKELYGALRLCFRPQASEEVAYLRRHGPLADVARGIEAEFPGALRPELPQGVAFTPNWLVVSSGSCFAARRLDDLVWVFMKRTTTRLNWVIPVWRTDALVFRFADGREAQAKCSKASGAKALEEAAGRCPWIAVGFTEELNRLWESDRGAFLALIQKDR